MSQIYSLPRSRIKSQSLYLAFKALHHFVPTLPDLWATSHVPGILDMWNYLSLVEFMNFSPLCLCTCFSLSPPLCLTNLCSALSTKPKIIPAPCPTSLAAVSLTPHSFLLLPLWEILYSTQGLTYLPLPWDHKLLKGKNSLVFNYSAHEKEDCLLHAKFSIGNCSSEKRWREPMGWRVLMLC